MYLKQHDITLGEGTASQNTRSTVCLCKQPVRKESQTLTKNTISKKATGIENKAIFKRVNFECVAADMDPLRDFSPPYFVHGGISHNLRVSHHCSSFLSYGWYGKDAVKSPVHVWMYL